MRNRDLHAVHQIMKAFETSKAQTDHMVDAIPAFLAVIDSDGLILRINDEAAELMGLSEQEVLARDLRTVFESEFRKIFDHHFDLLRSGRSSREEFDLPVALRTGEKRTYLWDMVPLDTQVEGRRPFKILGRDVTDFQKRVTESVTLSKELEVATTIQSLLLPKQARISTGNLRMAAHYQPAEKVGGDWWRYDQENDNSLLVLLADVCGHGIGAAMVTGVLGSSYNVIRKMIAETPRQNRVMRIFEMINTNLIQICGHEYWVAMSAVEVFPNRNELVFWNAGGPPLFIKHHDDQLVRVNSASSPLGSGILKVIPKSVKFTSGDRFFLFSDGIFDFEDTNGELFCLNRFGKVVKETQGDSIDSALEMIISDLRRSEKPNRPVKDDRTLIVVERV